MSSISEPMTLSTQSPPPQTFTGPIQTASTSTEYPVVFVESYPQVIAGQQRTLLTLLDTWKATGIPPIILVPGEGQYVDELKRLGLDVRIVQQPAQLDRYGGAIYHDGLITKAKTKFQALAYIRQLRRFLKANKVQGVFCNDMRGILTAGVAARSLRLPVMTWDKLDKPHGLLDLVELPLVQRVAIISNAVLTKFPKWQVNWFRDRISLVPNGADLGRFEAAKPIRATLGLNAHEIVIGIVGTVCERKGHDRILAIWPELVERFPDARLLVVGSWSDDQEHERYFHSLPNRSDTRVRFLGARPAHEMPGILRSLDLLAVPSRHEGMGQVVAEAMACSIPVVGACAGGIPEIVADGETGLLFDGDNPESILDAVSKLCASRELRVQMGQVGRKRAERYFNRPVQMQRICQLFLDLLPNTDAQHKQET